MPPRPVWRVRDRASFAALRHHGRRARRGPLTVTWIPPGPDAAGGSRPSRLAVGIPRRHGPAVVRNRLRRRLRAAFAGLDAVVPGTYLVTVGPEAAATGFDDLRRALSDAVTAVTATAEAAP